MNKIVNIVDEITNSHMKNDRIYNSWYASNIIMEYFKMISEEVLQGGKCELLYNFGTLVILKKPQNNRILTGVSFANKNSSFGDVVRFGYRYEVCLIGNKLKKRGLEYSPSGKWFKKRLKKILQTTELDYRSQLI